MWFKFNDDFFDSPKIKLIKSKPNGLQAICIYIELVTMANKQLDSGYIYYDSKTKYTNEMFSILLNVSLDTVNEAFAILEEAKLISNQEEKGLLIIDFEQFQELKKETEKKKAKTNAERQAEYRSKIKASKSETQSNAKVTSEVTKKITEKVTERNGDVTNDVTKKVTQSNAKVTGSNEEVTQSNERNGLETLDNQRREKKRNESNALDKEKDIDKDIDKIRKDNSSQKSVTTSCEVMSIHSDFYEMKTKLEKSFCQTFNSTNIMDLNICLDRGINSDLITKAIEITQLNNRINKKISYALSICKSWINDGIFTVQQFEEREGFSNGNSSNSNGNNTNELSTGDKQRLEFLQLGATITDEELECEY